MEWYVGSSVETGPKTVVAGGGQLGRLSETVLRSGVVAFPQCLLVRTILSSTVPVGT